MSDPIGGTIASVASLVSQLTPVKSSVDGVVNGLNATVKTLCDDAGWSGAAADAMQAHWEVSGFGAAMVGALCQATHEVLNQLVADLTQAEHTLEEAMSEARAAGVPVPADGTPPKPPAGPTTGGNDAYAVYLYEWTRIRGVAQGYRLVAENELLQIADQIAVIIDPEADTEGLATADKLAIADYIKGIGAFRGSAVGYQKGVVAKARDDYNRAKQAWQEARDNRLPGERIPEGIKAERSAALRDLGTMESELADLERTDLPGLRFLNTSIAEVGGRLPGGLGEAFSRVAESSGILKSLGDVPVLDVAVGVGATYFQATDDIQKGANPVVAYAEDGTSNAVGLGAGALAGAGVATLAGALGAGPVLAVGAGAVVGGAVVVGVGDLVYEGFHENWSQDIHDRGVVSGILHGTGHMFSQTGGDLKDMAVGIGHGATSLWHSVFG